MALQVALLSGMAYRGMRLAAWLRGAPHWADAWLFGVLALSQFVLNYTLAVLFRHHDVSRAQRPFLLSSVAIIGLEMLTEHKWFAPLHLVFLLVVIAVVYLITLTDPARTLKQVGGRWSRRRPKPEEEEVALT